MSEQPPRPSGHLPLPGDATSHGFEPDPEERIRGTAGEGLDRAADAARRLGHRAREQGGIAGHAEPIAYRVGDSLQNAAAYVREHDVQSMREDVEVGVRASPLKALAMAAFGGFLLGRLLR